MKIIIFLSEKVDNYMKDIIESESLNFSVKSETDKTFCFSPINARENLHPNFIYILFFFCKQNQLKLFPSRSYFWNKQNSITK